MSSFSYKSGTMRQQTLVRFVLERNDGCVNDVVGAKERVHAKIEGRTFGHRKSGTETKPAKSKVSQLVRRFTSAVPELEKGSVLRHPRDVVARAPWRK